MLLFCCVCLFFVFKPRKYKLGDKRFWLQIIWEVEVHFRALMATAKTHQPMTLIRIKFLDQKCEKRISGWDVTVGLKKASMVHQPHCIDLLVGLHYNQQDKNPARGIAKPKPKNNLKEGFTSLSRWHLKRDWQSLSFMCPKQRDLSYSHFCDSWKKGVSQIKCHYNIQQHATKPYICRQCRLTELPHSEMKAAEQFYWEVNLSADISRWFHCREQDASSCPDRPQQQSQKCWGCSARPPWYIGSKHTNTEGLNEWSLRAKLTLVWI